MCLYSTVQYYDKFLVGHPTKIYNPTEYDPLWFDLVKCTDLPARKLYHPMLLVKTDKLSFVLCRGCLSDNSEEYIHTDGEIMFTGTWSTLELNKVIEKVLKIDEEWHFEKKSSDLYKEYIHDITKIKLETKYELNEAYARARENKP